MLKYEDVDDPVAGKGEILVRVAATSVNPVDYKMRTGEAKERFPVTFPGILGRDISGIVRTVGEGVTGFSPGDKVMALGNAAYAELVVVKATDVAHVPDRLDLVEAAALPLVTLTGEQLIRLGTKIQKGQTVLVTGATGSVGRSAVWTAKKAGAVVIAGVRKSQLHLAESLGAAHVLALDDSTDMESLGFVDSIANTVGGKTAEMLLGKVKQGGIFASVLGPPAHAMLHPTVQIVSVKVVPDAATLRTLAEDIARKRFVIPIDRMMPLAEAGVAQTIVEKGGVGKVLLLA